MIRFINRDNIHVPIELHTALVNVEQTYMWLKGDIDQLPIVTFDPLYTKPVNLTSVDILAESLFEHDVHVTIKLYTQNWFSYKYAPVNAHIKDSEPTTIYINTRMFKWAYTTKDWMETLFHECIHQMDHHSMMSFSHGSNTLKGKDNTAPVKLAKILNSLDFSGAGLAYEQ